ncbi:MAG: ribosome assembly RNA-binding protein YhbY [Atopostipes suicloacalis]|nr:ribosome assembly RNA-binding protein YhbY [Atopostipes suicloacalis]MDN6731698.1 ribosome assembly RNA-binding protein YhbY [Atopostipes suicloacalis]
MLKLTGKQKRFLRAEANHFSPMFQIGKNNLTEEIVDEYVDGLSKRELIKVQILQNATITTKEAAKFIEEHSEITVVQIIGRVLVLYLPAEEEKYRRYSNKFPMTGH